MMKRYVFFLIFLFPIFVCAQNLYYYTQGNKVYLSENQFVKYIKVNDSISEGQALEIQQSIGLFCWRVDEFSPFFNKYYINEHQFTEFLGAYDGYRSLIDWKSSNYALEDTNTFYPTGLIFAKILQGTDLQLVLTQLEVPYDSIRQDKYTPLLFRIYVQPDQAVRVSALLYETGLFVYSTPDFMESCELSGYNDNPHFQYQWAVNHPDVNMNLLSAWATTSGHPNVKIAVLDVGVDLYHPDLVDNLLEGYDAVNDDVFPSTVCCGEYETEEDWHGTCCAGIIGAANNNIGVVGVAHTSKIIPIRFCHSVLYSSKDFNPYDRPISSWLLRSSSEWFVDALNHACYEDSADVISCSFRVGYNDMIRDKLTEICSQGRDGKGCVVVFGSDNSYDTIPDFLNCQMSPISKHPCVISVGSITPCGKRVIYGDHCNLNSYYSSCYGDSLDVVAPGIHIPTTMIEERYTDIFAGTSSATPHVAGVAALILSVNPCLTREEVKYIIESTCTKVRQDVYTYGNNPNHPNGTWNIEVGHGLVNAGAAVALAQQMGGYIYMNDSVISSSVSWNTDRMINQDLFIDSLATLIITDTLYVGNDARIIVRPGGKLIVDGGTLTNACTGEMWQGIFVEGNRNLHQTEANQGTVVLRNGAVIENAICGIRTGAPGDSTITTGGIIYASNTTFRNNRRAVAFYPYADIVSGTTVRDNFSGFSNCTFTVDNDNLFAANNTAFDAHVSLWDVKGVTFEGCTFTNATTAMTFDKGYAIKSIDAGFRVATLCDTVLVEPTTICQCPENKATYSQFSGFLTAISASTSGNTYYVLVDEAQFSNNGTGISVSGNNHVTVTRNDFDMNSLPGTITEGTGLSLSGCTGYLVEENDFHRTALSNNLPFEGIRVTNSGTAANLLYRNDFSRLNKAVTVVGTNRGMKIPVGLECRCNTFYGNQYDIYVAANSSMSPQQGSSSAGADNQFSGTTVSSLYNAGSYAITYYNSGTGIGLVPYNPTSNVTVWSNAAANPCQSTLCGSGNVLPPPGPIKSPDAGYLALKAQYDTLLSEFELRGYADIVADPSEDLHTQADILSARLAFAQLGELERELHARSGNAVRALLRDTLLDLPALESWFAVTPGLSSRYSLAETEYLSGASNVLTLQGVSALLETEEERDEYDNYMAFNALKEALSGYLHGHADWPSATELQIAELQRIADANTGRSSVMARGVLCFFFGICEDEDFTVMGDPRHLVATGENDISSHHQDVSMKLYPNPATNTLHIEFEGLDDPQGTITVADITGVVVQYVETSQRGVTIDVSHLTPGLYVVSFRNKNGVVVRKFVKM